MAGWQDLAVETQEIILIGAATGSLPGKASPARVIYLKFSLNYRLIHVLPQTKPFIINTTPPRLEVKNIYTVTFPDETLNPNLAWINQCTRNIYLRLWPGMLGLSSSKMVRWNPRRDTVFLDHEDLYVLRQYCKEFYEQHPVVPISAEEEERRVRLNELIGFHAIRSIETTLSEFNYRIMYDLRYRFSRPLRSLRRCALGMRKDGAVDTDGMVIRKQLGVSMGKFQQQVFEDAEDGGRERVLREEVRRRLMRLREVLYDEIGSAFWWKSIMEFKAEFGGKLDPEKDEDWKTIESSKGEL